MHDDVPHPTGVPRSWELELVRSLNPQEDEITDGGHQFSPFRFLIRRLHLILASLHETRTVSYFCFYYIYAGRTRIQTRLTLIEEGQCDKSEKKSLK